MSKRHVLVSLGLFTGFFAVAACDVGTTDQTDETVATGDDALKGCNKASDCHGPLPQLCEVCSGGTSACAHWECKAHKCVDTICPTPAPECTKASDCHGPLPDICEVCSSGSSECAHWA